MLKICQFWINLRQVCGIVGCADLLSAIFFMAALLVLYPFNYHQAQEVKASSNGKEALVENDAKNKVNGNERKCNNVLFFYLCYTYSLLVVYSIYFLLDFYYLVLETSAFLNSNLRKRHNILIENQIVEKKSNRIKTFSREDSFSFLLLFISFLLAAIGMLCKESGFENIYENLFCKHCILNTNRQETYKIFLFFPHT